MAWKSLDGGRGVAWGWFDEDELRGIATGEKPDQRKDLLEGAHGHKK